MNVTRRLSLLTTIALCALALIFTGQDASAAQGRLIGTLRVRPQTHARVNHQSANEGNAIHNGDLVETGGDSAVINLNNSQCVLIFPNSKARIYVPENDGEIVVVIAQGGFRLLHPRRHPGDDFDHLPDSGIPGGGNGNLQNIINEALENEHEGLESLPYLGSFGFGNFSGTSVGGGGGSSSGGTTTGVLPNGKIGLFNSFGVLIREL